MTKCDICGCLPGDSRICHRCIEAHFPPEQTGLAYAPTGRSLTGPACTELARMVFVVPGPPMAWARAGAYGGRRFPRNKAYQNKVRSCAMAARPDGWPTNVRYVVTIHADTWGTQGDVDNYAKQVLDACQRGTAADCLWDNDSQIDRLVASKARAGFELDAALIVDVRAVE